VILVFGKTGQVAKELRRFDGVLALGREDVNLLNPQACANAILTYSPRAVINAAAYTAVDKAEDEELLATVVNAKAPTSMAKACASLLIPLVQLSSDYVFEGTGMRPWKPDDPVNPQTAYGRSKLAGELGVRKSNIVHAILRTSWVFSPHGTNFVKTMLHLSETRNFLTVVDDQIGGPTPAADIATACLEITEQLIKNPSKSGTYHFSGSPDVSWATFAANIFEQAEKSVIVSSISTNDYPTVARRPLNSRLDCYMTEKVFGIPRPDWRFELTSVLRDLKALS
jgi:dTDP-4-dehydrorhamnose reductase